MSVKRLIKNLAPHFILEWYLSYKLRNGWFKRKKTTQENHLEMYWNSRDSANRCKLIELLQREILNINNNQLKILEYGSHVGINLDIINSAQPDNSISFYAVEPNLEAIGFMKEKLPYVKCLHADDVGFVKNDSFPTGKVEISFVNSVFYCMSPRRVKSVLLKLSKISEVIVLGEGMMNLYGEESRFMTSPPCFQHPYRKWLEELNFIESWSVDAPDPRPQLNKFIAFRREPNFIK